MWDFLERSVVKLALIYLIYLLIIRQNDCAPNRADLVWPPKQALKAA